MKLKRESGISLISLVIIVAVIVVFANIVIYNVSDNMKVEKLKEMQNDINNLRDRIASYYVENGQIPASIQYTNIDNIKSSGVISEAADTGEFEVIDLSAIPNITLTYGKDFEKINSDSSDDVNQYTDLYIINKESHNIFYVEGITIDGDTFYTDYTKEDADKVKVDLKYVDNVKIPEGFSYVSGNKETELVVKETSTGEEYSWVEQKDKIKEIPASIAISTNEKQEFIESVNTFKGYYINRENEGKAYYLKAEEQWSNIYDEEGTYKDQNNDTAFIPKGYMVSKKPGENLVSEGLVIKDEKNNEWVWIDVPKSVYKNATSGTDYANIEKDLQEYTSSYRDEKYSDVWNSKTQYGFENQEEYNDAKNKMLESIYNKGGFYIGRYEVGSESPRDVNTEEFIEPNINMNKYPYNYVTGTKARELASNFGNENYTSNLMFGIQYDLVLKCIEEKGAKLASEIKTDSTNWGNYKDVSFTIKNGKYSVDPKNSETWEEVTENYTKPNSEVLLSTGVTSRNRVLNIYDLAGNVWEWTLETNLENSESCVCRGGYYGESTVDYAAATRSYGNSDSASYDVGFRASLY